MPWLWARKPSRNCCAQGKQIEGTDVAAYRRRTSQTKLAVFQVSEPGQRAALVCLEMRSLQEAAELEQWLRMNVRDKTLVKLLGRFDSVYFPANERGTEAVVFGGRGCFQSTPHQR